MPLSFSTCMCFCYIMQVIFYIQETLYDSYKQTIKLYWTLVMPRYVSRYNNAIIMIIMIHSNIPVLYICWFK